MKWRFIPFEGDQVYYVDGPTLEEAAQDLPEACYTIVENRELTENPEKYQFGDVRAISYEAYANPSWAFPCGKSEFGATANNVMVRMLSKFDAIKRNGGPVYSYQIIDLNALRAGKYGGVSPIYGPREKALAESEFDRMKADSGSNRDLHLLKFQR